MSTPSNDFIRPMSVPGVRHAGDPPSSPYIRELPAPTLTTFWFHSHRVAEGVARVLTQFFGSLAIVRLVPWGIETDVCARSVEAATTIAKEESAREWSEMVAEKVRERTTRVAGEAGR